MTFQHYVYLLYKITYSLFGVVLTLARSDSPSSSHNALQHSRRHLLCLAPSPRACHQHSHRTRWKGCDGNYNRRSPRHRNTRDICSGASRGLNAQWSTATTCKFSLRGDVAIAGHLFTNCAFNSFEKRLNATRACRAVPHYRAIAQSDGRRGTRDYARSRFLVLRAGKRSRPPQQSLITSPFISPRANGCVSSRWMRWHEMWRRSPMPITRTDITFSKYYFVRRTFVLTRNTWYTRIGLCDLAKVTSKGIFTVIIWYVHVGTHNRSRCWIWNCDTRVTMLPRHVITCVLIQ